MHLGFTSLPLFASFRRGALDGDVKLTKEQLRQIRVKSETRKPPAAPPMPTLETESEDESEEKPKATGWGPGMGEARYCLARLCYCLPRVSSAIFRQLKVFRLGKGSVL